METSPYTLAALTLSLLVPPLAILPVSAERQAERQTEKSLVIVKQVDSENRAWLGVVLGSRVETGKDQTRKSGVEVLQVMKDSPADKAGLQEGDVITRFEGKPVDEAENITKAIQGLKPGDRAKIEVRRDGRTEIHEATLAERKDDTIEIQIPGVDIPSLKLLGEHSNFVLQSALGKPRLGVRTMDLSDQLAEYFGTKEDEGVLVTEVIPESLAEKAGLQAGDVLLSWNSKTIADAEEVRRLARKAEKDETVRIGVLRRGTPMTFEVTFDTEPAPAGGPEFRFLNLEDGQSWFPKGKVEGSCCAAGCAHEGAMKACPEAMKACPEAMKACPEAMKACQKAMKLRGEALGMAHEEAMKACQEAMKVRGEALGIAHEEAMKACQDAVKAKGEAEHLRHRSLIWIPAPGEI